VIPPAPVKKGAESEGGKRRREKKRGRRLRHSCWGMDAPALINLSHSIRQRCVQQISVEENDLQVHQPWGDSSCNRHLVGQVCVAYTIISNSYITMPGCHFITDRGLHRLCKELWRKDIIFFFRFPIFRNYAHGFPQLGPFV